MIIEAVGYGAENDDGSGIGIGVGRGLVNKRSTGSLDGTVRSGEYEVL